jgi:alpha-tubulin suppressor-like RCC1 family protein
MSMSRYTLLPLTLAALLLAACADEPTRSTERALHTAPQASLTAAAPLALRQISVGVGHACGVTTTNIAYCWGANDLGQLGIGTSTGPERCHSVFLDVSCSTRPVRVAGGLAFHAVGSNGNATCGITTSSRAYCWGFNGEGQLGIGTSTGPQTCPSGGNNLACSTRPVAVVGPRL